MNGQSRHLLLLLLILPLAGCMSLSSGHRHSHPPARAKAGADTQPLDEEGGATQTVALDTRERRGEDLTRDPTEPAPADDGDVAPDSDPATDEPPLSADPHSERPGTTEEEAPPEARAVAFVAPDPKLRPIAPNRRPALPRRAVLALATVHAGQVVFDSEAVLALDTLLTKESALANVVGLEPPPLAEASLKDLAKVAHAMKRHLLLVDVSPGVESEDRVGYLLDARTGALLARWSVEKQSARSTPASSDTAPDLCERLARSYAQLVK